MLLQRVAVLDLGSNTVKLLVAERMRGNEPRALLEKSATTRLGEKMHRQSRLPESAMRRSLRAVGAFRRSCEKLRVRQWRAIATSAVRDATNRGEFEKRFRALMGFNLRVLSGKEEARLNFLAAISDPNLIQRGHPVLVMDSGGGSAQWILGVPGKTGSASGGIKQCVSLDLGAVRMTRRFLRGDPHTEHSFHALISHYKKNLRRLRSAFRVPRSTLLIGTGGGITTAAALWNSTFRVPRSAFGNWSVHGCKLTTADLESLLEKLRVMTQAQRLRLKGLPRDRADIITAGVALFVVAMKTLEISELRVSLRGLRYGVLIT